MIKKSFEDFYRFAIAGRYDDSIEHFIKEGYILADAWIESNIFRQKKFSNMEIMITFTRVHETDDVIADVEKSLFLFEI
jgi:hypothetical protein